MDLSGEMQLVKMQARFPHHDVPTISSLQRATAENLVSTILQLDDESLEVAGCLSKALGPFSQPEHASQYPAQLLDEMSGLVILCSPCMRTANDQETEALAMWLRNAQPIEVPSWVTTRRICVWSDVDLWHEFVLAYASLCKSM